MSHVGHVHAKFGVVKFLVFFVISVLNLYIEATKCQMRA